MSQTYHRTHKLQRFEWAMMFESPIPCHIIPPSSRIQNLHRKSFFCHDFSIGNPPALLTQLEIGTAFLLAEHFSLLWDKMYHSFILTHFSQVVLYLCFTDGNRGLEGLILKCLLKVWWEIRLHMTCEPTGERNDFEGSHRKLVGRRGNWNSPQIWDSASSVPLKPHAADSGHCHNQR